MKNFLRGFTTKRFFLGWATFALIAIGAIVVHDGNYWGLAFYAAAGIGASFWEDEIRRDERTRVLREAERLLVPIHKIQLRQ